MAGHLTDHVLEHQLQECYQSAYCPHHCTETALVMVQNDFLEAFDNKQGVILVLSDQSAAFDTIDHTFNSGDSSAAEVWHHWHCVCLYQVLPI